MGRIGQIFQNQMLLAVVASVLMLGVLLLVTGFLSYMGQDVGVVECAVTY